MKQILKKKWVWVIGILIVLGCVGGILGYNFLTNPFSTEDNQPNGQAPIEQVETKPVENNKVNILLVGIDQRTNEVSRSDTLLVLSMDMKKNKSVIVSIPRDSYVDIPGRGLDKITHAHALGGVNLTIKTVEQFLNIPINYYVRTNFEGFKDVVDALGGVTINVEKTMVYERIGANFTPGQHKMTGEQALAYVRYRSDAGSDFARMDRQQQFLKEILAETKQPATLIKLPQLIPAVKGAVNTNMSPAEILKYGKLAQDSNPSTYTLKGTGTNIGGVYYLKPNPDSLSEIKNKIAMND
jgi:polyisoprenyl-teichoic acid--peptidoglycan teichoic acid transferase